MMMMCGKCLIFLFNGTSRANPTTMRKMIVWKLGLLFCLSRLTQGNTTPLRGRNELSLDDEKTAEKLSFKNLKLSHDCSSSSKESTIESCHCNDFVPHLPGLNAPTSSAWYSGYLEYEVEGQQVHTHYVLVEAESDFRKDKPLLYWSNGGPGASSLFGLLTEIGPYFLDDRSLQTEEYQKTGIPTPIYNPSNWARLGHLLIFDQPAPVGFSYCNNETLSHSCGGIDWTDELASEASYKAMNAFYTKFPEYRSKELYLTGESYAGIYIPTLARRIVETPIENVTLKGFAVGDGCLGTETGICGMIGTDENTQPFDIWPILFMAGHGQLPLNTFTKVMHACQSFHTNDNDSSSTVFQVNMTPECRAAVDHAQEQVGGYFEYSLYDECIYDHDNGIMKGALNDYACGGDKVMEMYLKTKEVHQAFHLQGEFFSVDNAEGDFSYTPTEPDLTGFYREMNGQLKVLVYNGDTDPAITSFAAQNWTSHLGLNVEEDWRPWTVDGCRWVGGYVTRYSGGMDFVTIRGAGHMVPTYKAAATFEFLQSWLLDRDYPRYDANCTAPSSISSSIHSGNENGDDSKKWSSGGGSTSSTK